MLHRAIFGSIERFIGILIEHFGGAFPVWLSPLQVEVIPVNTEFHMDYANKVAETLKEAGLRVHVDGRNEKLGYRLREAQKNKTPLQLIIGDAEIESGSVNLRRYGERAQNSMQLDAFLELALNEVKDRTIHVIETEEK